jgi:hypothetical protein
MTLDSGKLSWTKAGREYGCPSRNADRVALRTGTVHASLIFGAAVLFAASFSRTGLPSLQGGVHGPIFERLSMITLPGKYRSSSPFSMDCEGLVPAATLFVSLIYACGCQCGRVLLRIPPSAVVDVPEYSTCELTVTLGQRAK